MESLVIDGGNRLRGGIRVQGAKNGALPVLAASVLGGRSVIHNCPRLTDTESSLEILRMLGCGAERDGEAVTVDASRVPRCDIPPELMRRMRSSVIFLGAVLARCGRAVVSAPGGCELGPRPIDMHLEAMRLLGADITESRGLVFCECAGRLKGAEIVLPYPSVGATENAVIAASTAKGRTVIVGAAKEPEITELADFINSKGGSVSGAGSDVLLIDGVEALGDCEHVCIPDRIAAATYIAAAAATGSELTLHGVLPEHLTAVTDVFARAGCRFREDVDALTVTAPERLRFIRTAPYPGFPTDAQALTAAALATADGVSVLCETVFSGRFRYLRELSRMGAEVSVEGQLAVIKGVPFLSGARTACTDLRGGAALAVAALGAHGRSEISAPGHIDRGYENVEAALSAAGARIYRKSEDETDHTDGRFREA